MAQPIKKENYEARLKKYGNFGFAYKYNGEMIGGYLLSAADTLAKRYKSAYDGARLLIKDGVNPQIYMTVLDVLRKPETIFDMLRNLTASYMMEGVAREYPCVAALSQSLLNSTPVVTQTLVSLMSFVTEEINKESFTEENLFVGTVEDIDLNVIMPNVNTFGEPEPKPGSDEERKCILVVKFKNGKIKCNLY